MGVRDHKENMCGGAPVRNIAKLNRNEREELFIVTAREVKLPEAMVEKDFWVCWTLDYLFHESQWKEHFACKG